MRLRGGSCNSGDEGIDTTEPVDEIEGNENGEPAGKTEEFEKSGSTDKIEENGSSELADHEEEPIGEVVDQVEEEETKDETIEGETEEIEATEKQEENAESTTPLMEEQEKSSREILLEKRCSLTHTPDNGSSEPADHEEEPIGEVADQ